MPVLVPVAPPIDVPRCPFACDITSIGMMDCKKALTEADGDKEGALKILKEKGLAVAAKRADRVTKEGVIASKKVIKSK